MIPPFYTFMEIVKFNSNDWAKAHEILTYYLERKDFRKEIRGPEDIIYHNVGQLEPFNLIHNRVFFTPPVQEEERPRRPRIGKTSF
jgi:hypothetical protein